MTNITYNIGRLCSKGIGLFLLISILGFNQALAQCNYTIPDGSTTTTAAIDVAGYETGATNICYIVDEAGAVTAVPTDGSGNCDFTGLPIGNYSVYVLNDCPAGASDIAGVDAPSTEAEITALAAAADVAMAGPTAFTVCGVSTLAACETEAITIASMPDFEEDGTMMYVLVCDGLVAGVSTGSPMSSGLTVPDDGDPTMTPACTAYALNYCSPGGDAAATAITGGSTWTNVDPTGNASFNVISAAVDVSCAMQAPIAMPDAGTTPADVPLVIDVIDNDMDPNSDLDPTTVTIIGGGPATGSVAIDPSTGEITYTPDGTTVGSVSFQYQVCDRTTPTAMCATTTVTITLDAALPLDLLGFSTECDDDENVRLKWVTAQEENILQFVIERSIDGQDGWIQIGIEKARGGVGQTSYTYVDDRSTGNAYYRLQIVENDGLFGFSGVISSKCLTGGFVLSHVMPNPTFDNITLTFETSDRNPVKFQLVDVLGRVLMEEEITPVIGLNIKEVNMERLSSAYYVIILNNGKKQLVERVLKR